MFWFRGGVGGGPPHDSSEFIFPMEEIVAANSSSNVQPLSVSHTVSNPIDGYRTPYEQSGEGWTKDINMAFPDQPNWVYHRKPDASKGFVESWDPSYFWYDLNPYGQINEKYYGRWSEAKDDSSPYWGTNGQNGSMSGTPGYMDPVVVEDPTTDFGDPNIPPEIPNERPPGPPKYVRRRDDFVVPNAWPYRLRRRRYRRKFARF